jgi:hypothetical protein
MSRPSAQQVRELAQFYATEGDAYGHLAEDLARESARFEVEEAAFEERVQSLAPVIWGELTKHDPNSWPEMSVHSLEGAKDVARVVLVWLDAQAPETAETSRVPGVWERFEDLPEGVIVVGTDGSKYVRYRDNTHPDDVARWNQFAPFVRADG